MLWPVVYQTQDTLGPYHLHEPWSGAGWWVLNKCLYWEGPLHTLCRTLHPF